MTAGRSAQAGPFTRVISAMVGSVTAQSVAGRPNARHHCAVGGGWRREHPTCPPRPACPGGVAASYASSSPESCGE